MARQYRKREGNRYDTWHFCTNCNNWPKRPTRYISRGTRPSSGELCDECKAKENRGVCRNS